MNPDDAFANLDLLWERLEDAYHAGNLSAAAELMGEIDDFEERLAAGDDDDDPRQRVRDSHL